MVDIRREREHIFRKGHRFIQQTIGEVVVWWEYDAVESEYHHVYDEPSLTAKRVWRPPILVPVLWVNETEAGRTNEREGRLVTNTLRLGVPVRVLRSVGLSEPQDNRRHLNDLLLYRRMLWSIGAYDVRGRLRDAGNVGVSATQVKPDDDMPYDNLPTFNGVAFTDRPTGFPSQGYDNQTFEDHELPAYHEP